MNFNKKIFHPQKLVKMAVIALSVQGCSSLDIKTDHKSIAKIPVEWSNHAPRYPMDVGANPQTTQLTMQLPLPIQQLVKEALAHNQDLKVTAARLDISRAAQGATQSQLWPNARFNLGANQSEIRSSDSASSTSTRSYSAGITTGWEVDLWRRLRFASEAAENDVQAQELTLEYARQSLVANVVLTWLDVIETQQLLDLAQRNLSLQQQRLSHLERRMDRGLTNALDVRLTRNNVANLQDRLLQQDANYHNALRRLDVLAGRYPSAAPIALAELPQIGQFQPIFAPRDLLEHRPDLLAAEKKLVAEKLRVQEAKKRLWPQLNLTGSYASRTSQDTELFDFENWLDSISASLLLPLFEGGKLRADVARQQANSELAIAQYRQATLKAWQEVETYLYGEKILLAREEILAIAKQEADAAEVLTQRQYEQGLATSFEFITAQNRRINAEENYIQSKIARVANRIGLHLALGISIETQSSTQ